MHEGNKLIPMRSSTVVIITWKESKRKDKHREKQKQNTIQCACVCVCLQNCTSELGFLSHPAALSVMHVKKNATMYHLDEALHCFQIWFLNTRFSSPFKEASPTGRGGVSLWVKGRPLKAGGITTTIRRSILWLYYPYKHYIHYLTHSSSLPLYPV